MSSPEEQGDTVSFNLSAMGKDVSAESALLADMHRLGIDIDVLGEVDITSPDVGSGIYRTQYGTFVKFLSPPVPSSPPSSHSSTRNATTMQTASQETQNSTPSRCIYDRADRAEQGRLVPPLSSHSHAPPPATPNTAYYAPVPYQSQSVLPPSFTVVPLLVDPPCGEAHGYTMEVRLEYLIMRDPPRFAMSNLDDEQGEPLVYNLTADTGGGVDSWIFSNLPQAQFSHVVGSAPFPNNVETLRLEKNKIGHPPQPAVAADVTQLHYGYPPPAGALHTVVEVEQTLVNVYSWDTANHRPVPLAKDFAIGAVRGADGNVFLRKSDGLLALGRWSDAPRFTGHNPSGTWTSNITTLVGALYNAKRIQVKRFTIRIAHPTLDLPGGASFICFGRFQDASARLSPPGCLAPGSPWQSVECSYENPLAPGVQRAWMLDLRRITIHSAEAGFSPVNIDVNAHVILDTGSAYTLLPQTSIAVLHSYLTSINAHNSGIASNIPATTRISFTFTEKPETGHRDVQVTGQAIRFLVNPLESSVRRQGNVACTYAAPGHNGPYLLGLNFFRTFCVSFEESDMAPSVRMVAQKDVAHR